MKTIKLKDVEVSVEEIKKLIKENPELLKEEKGGRYFFPRKNEQYWFIAAFGDVDWNINNYIGEAQMVSKGVYRTKEEAELACDKQKAIVSCWKWAQENAPFEPDWGDIKQNKYYVYYSYGDKELNWNYTLNGQSQFTLPYFKSREDIEAFIKANKDSLELLFTR